MQERISLASYSFHKHLERGMIDVFGYLEATKHRYHVPYADIWNGYFKGCYDAEYLGKIREAMDERGLELASLCCDWAHAWATAEIGEEAAQLDATAEECMKAAEILGAKTVRFDVGIRNDEPSEEQMDRVAARFLKHAQRAYDHGYVVGPENHWGASRKLRVQQELFARVNHPGYGMLLHLGNWDLAEGETLEGNDKIAAGTMAAHTHVDFTQSPFACEKLPALREAGYQGVWGLEHHTEIDEYAKVALQLAQIRLARC